MQWSKAQRKWALFIGLPILSGLVGFYGVKWMIGGGEVPERAGERPTIEQAVTEEDQSMVDEPASQEEEAMEPPSIEEAETEDPAPAATPSQVPYRTRSVTLYGVQVASFSDEESAMTAAAGLVAEGHTSTAIFYDGWHKVILFASSNRQRAEEVLNDLGEDQEGFILTFTLGDETFDVPPDMKDTVATFDAALMDLIIDYADRAQESEGFAPMRTPALPEDWPKTLAIGKKLSQVQGALSSMENMPESATLQGFLTVLSAYTYGE